MMLLTGSVTDVVCFLNDVVVSVVYDVTLVVNVKDERNLAPTYYKKRQLT